MIKSENLSTETDQNLKSRFQLKEERIYINKARSFYKHVRCWTSAEVKRHSQQPEWRRRRELEFSPWSRFTVLDLCTIAVSSNDLVVDADERYPKTDDAIDTTAEVLSPDS